MLTCTTQHGKCVQYSTAHLPEGHEDDRLDQHKLEKRVVGGQQVMRPEVEQQQGIQSHCICDIVHNGDPQVPALHNSCCDKTTSLRSQDMLACSLDQSVQVNSAGMNAVKALSVACCEAGVKTAQQAVSNACQTADVADRKNFRQGIASKLVVSLLPMTGYFC